MWYHFNMRILCISDYKDPVIYSTSIKECFGNVDFVLSAGDLPLDYLEFVVSSLDRPLYYVFGNHHLEEYDYWMNRIRVAASDWTNVSKPHAGLGAAFIGGRLVRANKLLVAGLGGVQRYNNGNNQYTETEMRFRILKLAPRLLLNKLLYGRFLDILLTHSPPFGIHDQDDLCHRGFKSFLLFMRLFKPRFLLHGHIHIYDSSTIRKSRFCETDIINVYGHYILDTGGCSKT
jgi:Icc-related predicted phosphoesterase